MNNNAHDKGGQGTSRFSIDRRGAFKYSNSAAHERTKIFQPVQFKANYSNQSRSIPGTVKSECCVGMIGTLLNGDLTAATISDRQRLLPITRDIPLAAFRMLSLTGQTAVKRAINVFGQQ